MTPWEATCQICDVYLEDDGSCQNPHCPRGRETQAPEPEQNDTMVRSSPRKMTPSAANIPFQIEGGSPRYSPSSGSFQVVRLPDQDASTWSTKGRSRRDAFFPPPPGRPSMPVRDTQPNFPVVTPDTISVAPLTEEAPSSDRPTPLETPAARRDSPAVGQSGARRITSLVSDDEDSSNSSTG